MLPMQTPLKPQRARQTSAWISTRRRATLIWPPKRRKAGSSHMLRYTRLLVARAPSAQMARSLRRDRLMALCGCVSWCINTSIHVFMITHVSVDNLFVIHVFVSRSCGFEMVDCCRLTSILPDTPTYVITDIQHKASPLEQGCVRHTDATRHPSPPGTHDGLSFVTSALIHCLCCLSFVVVVGSLSSMLLAVPPAVILRLCMLFGNTLSCLC